MAEERFFDAAPRADWQERDRISEIAQHYRLCYKAMAAGHGEDRAYLADRYGRPTHTVGELHNLAQHLWDQLDEEHRELDRVDCERQLQAAIDRLEEGPDHA
jgi:hypothetical protein